MDRMRVPKREEGPSWPTSMNTGGTWTKPPTSMIEDSSSLVAFIITSVISILLVDEVSGNY